MALSASKLLILLVAQSSPEINEHIKAMREWVESWTSVISSSASKQY